MVRAEGGDSPAARCRSHRARDATPGQHPSPTPACVIGMGQTFASTDDYLQLFGIQASAQLWSQPLPHHTGIIVWTPEYQHHCWHNEDCADSLMPTITEY
ncbi:MAG: hypothetical protein IJS59_04380 [Bacteroidaceae bacterium]|nr:hypothetical protein [Bacteroidaceae bacterium]